MWISGNGEVKPEDGTSGNAWHAALNKDDFFWANADQGPNDGTPEKYSIDVSHIQFGYGPPINDAPVQLGDLWGSAEDNKYGGAVLLFDVKYVSFSRTADGFSMRNPASYGKALFIQGSDDLLKTTTGIDSSMPWTALAVTFYAGFAEYGSLSCPCCFGPEGGWQPGGANFCKDVLVQDILVPIIDAPWPSKDCYAAPGLFASKWGVKCDDADAFPLTTDSTIYVENINYNNLLIVNNSYNNIRVPLVHWQMNSNTDKVITYQLDNTAVRFDNFYSDSFFVGDQGLLFYNWGTDDYAAQIAGDGIIDATGISSHMFNTAPCSDGDGGKLKWRICPMDGDVPDDSYKTDFDTAQLCGAYKDNDELTYAQACTMVTSQVVDLDRPTAKMYGSLPCETTQNFCGLGFPYSR